MSIEGSPRDRNLAYYTYKDSLRVIIKLKPDFILLGFIFSDMLDSKDEKLLASQRKVAEELLGQLRNNPCYTIANQEAAERCLHSTDITEWEKEHAIFIQPTEENTVASACKALISDLKAIDKNYLMEKRGKKTGQPTGRISP